MSVLRELVYPNLARVFYFNMLISLNNVNRIVSNVAAVTIEFDVNDLNIILRTKHKGVLSIFI